jgi:hypothetical protein
MTLTTDDYSNIERLVRQGVVKAEGILWMKSIINWKWFYYATLTDDAL